MSPLLALFIAGWYHILGYLVPLFAADWFTNKLHDAENYITHVLPVVGLIAIAFGFLLYKTHSKHLMGFIGWGLLLIIGFPILLIVVGWFMAGMPALPSLGT